MNTRTNFGYWIPFDAKKGSTANYILNSTIQDYIRVLPAKHILLISDSCFSGSLLTEGASKSTWALAELDRRKSRWGLCSGRHDEEVNDGPPGENSPFAKSIIALLAHNNNQAIAVGALAQQVIELTAAQYRQLPEGRPIFDVGHEGGQYIFNLKDTAIASSDLKVGTNNKPELTQKGAITKTQNSFFQKNKWLLSILGAIFFIVASWGLWRLTVPTDKSTTKGKVVLLEDGNNWQQLSLKGNFLSWEEAKKGL